MTAPTSRARATACANIALSKYWGKADIANNVPAVPSVSLTLDKLVTQTEVRFDASRSCDEVILDGTPAEGRPYDRVVRILDEVRRSARLDRRARVVTRNAFPTAAGLASSASGFCALVAATRAAAGLPRDDKVISRLARKASASAARSVWGGFVELPAGKSGQANLSARPLFDGEHWDVRLVVALTGVGAKAVGSTEGMERSRKTSPLYEAWLEMAPKLSASLKRGLKQRDIHRVGRAMEQSTVAFHSCAMTSVDPIYYWRPATLSALACVRSLRERGVAVYATMDAGPHVKALCETRDARRVAAALRRTPDVVDVLVAKPGPGVVVR